jgi:hypothetical protein
MYGIEIPSRDLRKLAHPQVIPYCSSAFKTNMGSFSLLSVWVGKIVQHVANDVIEQLLGKP